eukprot:11311307-Karenia_brevis.AAC.1
MTDKTTTIADFMNRHEIDALFLQETRLDELTAKSAEIAFQKLGFTLIPGTQAKDSRGRNAAGTATVVRIDAQEDYMPEGIGKGRAQIIRIDHGERRPLRVINIYGYANDKEGTK